MEMADQPDDRQTERDHQDQENDAAFPPFLAQRFASSAGAAVVSPAFILERDRNIQTAPPFTGAGQQFLALPAGGFFGHAGSFRDHSLELLHFPAQLRFALGEFLLFLVERRSVFSRSAAHAKSRNPRGHPEENHERHNPKNNQRQGERETDLQPLSERSAAAQPQAAGSDVRQVDLG